MQHDLPGDFHWLRLHQLGAILGQVASEDRADIDERTAAANHAGVMWAVADNIAFRAQNRVLQSDSIQSDTRKGFRIRLLHHKPPGRGYSCDHFAGDAWA